MNAAETDQTRYDVEQRQSGQRLEPRTERAWPDHSPSPPTYQEEDQVPLLSMMEALAIPMQRNERRQIRRQRDTQPRHPGTQAQNQEDEVPLLERHAEQRDPGVLSPLSGLPGFLDELYQGLARLRLIVDGAQEKLDEATVAAPPPRTVG